MDEDYDHNFGFVLNDVARLMRITYDRRMKPLGLTRSQWWVLNHLYFHQGINQSELADLLDIEKAALGRLLDRLEAKTCVRRKSSGRANCYTATAAVEDLIALRLRETADRLCEGSLTPLLTHLVSASRLEPGEIRALRRLVARLDAAREE